MKFNSLYCWLIALVCIASSSCSYVRNFNRPNISPFTVMYQFMTPSLYKDVTGIDSRAAFVMDSNRIENNQLAKSVKNNEDKHVIVVNLVESFFAGANARILQSVHDLKREFEETTGMELKFVLFPQMRHARAQEYVNAFESKNVGVITTFREINVRGDIPEILQTILLVHNEDFEDKDYKTLKKRIKDSKSNRLKLEEYMSDVVPVQFIRAPIVPPAAARAVPAPAPAPARVVPNRVPIGNPAAVPVFNAGLNRPAQQAQPDFARYGYRLPQPAPAAVVPPRINSSPFSIIFKGIDNFESIPERHKVNGITLVVSTDIVSERSEMIQRALNANATLILQLTIDEFQSISNDAIDNEDSLQYLVDFSKYNGIQFSFKYLMPPENGVDVHSPVQNLGMFGGIQMVIPRSTLDLNSEIDVFEGAIIVDISHQPAAIFRKLDVALDHSGNSRLILSPFTNVFTARPELNELQKCAQFRVDLARTLINNAIMNFINLRLNRATALEESFDAMRFLSAQQWKGLDLRINYVGEDGIDAGGLKRDWFALMSREMFNPNYALFKSSDNNQNNFQPNERSFINDQHLNYFRFFGFFIGKAILDNIPINCHFSRFIYKQMIGLDLQLHDVIEIDAALYRALCWILDNDVSDIAGETTFTIDTEVFGERRVVDLKPNGSRIHISNQNKAEYVELMVQYKLKKEIEPQMAAFFDGFHELIPNALIQNFKVSELETLIAGASIINVDDWQQNTLYQTIDLERSREVVWFWQAVRSFDQNELRLLLKFATGSPSVPVEGFAYLRNRGEIQKFTINRDLTYNPNFDRFPKSHTCFNTIDMPLFRSYEDLRAKFLQAINNVNDGIFNS